MKKINLHFEFRGRHYEALVRVRQRDNGTDYNVTALDWELERILYGNQVICEIDGVLQVNVLPEREEQTELKLIIASHLSEFLNIPCFVGDSCLVGGICEEGWEDSSIPSISNS